MVPKQSGVIDDERVCFRAVLFRMVPKLVYLLLIYLDSFRAVLFRMVPKLSHHPFCIGYSFRAVLFRMVPKPD